VTDSLGLVERVAALHRVDLFAEVPGRVLAAVAEGAAEVRATPGELLIEQGAVEAHLYAGSKAAFVCTRANRRS
jgi:hypothetical protein